MIHIKRRNDDQVYQVLKKDAEFNSWLMNKIVRFWIENWCLNRWKMVRNWEGQR